jgi:hypothetical protein
MEYFDDDLPRPPREAAAEPESRRYICGPLSWWPELAFPPGGVALWDGTMPSRSPGLAGQEVDEVPGDALGRDRGGPAVHDQYRG